MSMDKLFKSEERPYISPIINLRTFLEGATVQENKLNELFTVPEFNLATIDSAECSSGSNACQSKDPRVKFTQFLVDRGYTIEDAKKAIGKGDGMLAKLFNAYPIGEYEVTFPPKDSKLMTHKVLHQIRESHQTARVKNDLVGRGKYFKYREQELRRYYDSGSKTEKDVVITVHLLKPFNRTPEQYDYASLKQRCEVKLLLRGDMSLVRLREKIFCASDFWSDLEDFEVLSAKHCFTNKFTSSFFFFHDTFYIDLRQPSSSDITEPIREFLDRKGKEFGPHKVVDMSTVKVIDLKLRLGQPYLYQHQGRCEHILIFTDLRLLNASDVQNIGDYPIRLYDSIQQKMCGVCNGCVASFVVTLSDRLPMTPAYFCRDCFRTFHYDGDNRVGDFKAYHYLDHAGTE